MLSAPDIWYACVHLEEDVSAYIHLQEDMSAGVHGEEAALAGHGMNLERRCPRRSRGRASPPPPRPAAKVSIEMIRWTGLAQYSLFQVALQFRVLGLGLSRGPASPPPPQPAAKVHDLGFTGVPRS